MMWARCSQLAFWEEVKEDAQERWSCMASQGKWEMLWSPTRLNFSKVASDMGNFLIKRPAKYWKGLYLLLPSSSLKIRSASQAEVHSQSLGDLDHLGCSWASPQRMFLFSWLVTRTQNNFQAPPPGCHLHVNTGKVQNQLRNQWKDKRAFLLIGLPGMSFIERLLCRGVNHLGNQVQVINRKLQLVKWFKCFCELYF